MAEKITAKELKARLDEGESLLVVNVLGEDSFQKEHIPSSVNILLKEGFVDRFQQEYPDTSREIVVHCSSFECDASKSAARKLERAGYENILEFDGGIQEWKDEGYELESS